MDSFEGFKEQLSEYESLFLKEMFTDVLFEKITSLFKNFNKVIIQKGFIPEVLSKIQEKAFSVVYYDCDTYESCKETLIYLFPIMYINGCFAMHDYFAKAEGAIGVKKAVDEFLRYNGNIEIIILPETTHIILKKI